MNFKIEKLMIRIKKNVCYRFVHAYLHLILIYTTIHSHSSNIAGMWLTQHVIKIAYILLLNKWQALGLLNTHLYIIFKKFLFSSSLYLFFITLKVQVIYYTMSRILDTGDILHSQILCTHT